MEITIAVMVLGVFVGAIVGAIGMKDRNAGSPRKTLPVGNYRILCEVRDVVDGHCGLVAALSDTGKEQDLYFYVQFPDSFDSKVEIGSVFAVHMDLQWHNIS